MNTQIIAQTDTEQYARDRLLAEMAEHGWPVPREVTYLEQVDLADGRPALVVSMHTAADVHRAAWLMGRVPAFRYHVGLKPHATDPAGPWAASRYTWMAVDRWCGDVDLQVSCLEHVDGGVA